MLSRRTLIASTAVLAAGCGGPDSPLLGLRPRQQVPLTWVSRPYTGLINELGPLSFEGKLRRIVQELAADTESPFGPMPGHYHLFLRYVKHYAGSYSDPNAEQFRKIDHLVAWLGEVEVDLVTLWADEIRALGETGVLLPLDRFGGVDGADFEKEFYAPVLEPFRASGTLYALPADAFPLMLFYDADFFAHMGLAPPDENWDWDVLVESALKLTQREDDGTVSRWGLVTHQNFFPWWALWQNEAEMAEALTLQCRLQEPAALEALEFFRGLMHSHGVSPTEFGMDLWRLIGNPASSPPAILYDTFYSAGSRFDYRRATLPQGKVHSVPVETQIGIAIVAQTGSSDEAYAALRGLLHTMRPYVHVPSEREAVARLGQIRTDIQPNEVAAIQHSMEHARLVPSDVAQSRAMYSLAEALVRGEEVASAVNQACSVLYENQGT